MAVLIATPTSKGLEILNREMSASSTRFCLLGSDLYSDNELDVLVQNGDMNYSDIEDYIIYTNSLEGGFFNEDGNLQLEALVPFELDIQKYMYAFLLLDNDNNILCIVPTPKVMLSIGVGGNITLVIAIKGETGEIVFKSTIYVTHTELDFMFGELCDILDKNNKFLVYGFADVPDDFGKLSEYASAFEDVFEIAPIEDKSIDDFGKLSEYTSELRDIFEIAHIEDKSIDSFGNFSEYEELISKVIESEK